MTKARSFLHFLWAALRNPLQVSTVFQTGDKVSGIMAAAIPRGTGLPVVELGVGTGAITASIFENLDDPSQYIGLEVNGKMVEFASERFPQGRFIKASAETFMSYLNGQQAAAVMSSLPWTLMPAETVESILSSVAACLAPDGVFATYITLHVLKTPAGRRVQSAIEARFSRVENTVVGSNLPPAKVFLARV
jgi:phospholipid N-methyltransferase